MEKNESICKWSVQKNGLCPYEEILSMIINDFKEKKIRCEGKKCLDVILNITGKKSEKEVIDIYAPEFKKPTGPHDSTELITNFNIEDVLKDFSITSLKKNTEFTNGPFLHVRFEMRDFMKSTISELRDLNFKDLYTRGFRTFGCILNTDKWSGPGKHWVCIFGTIDQNNINVEYFNSSGRKVDRYESLLKWKKLKNTEGYNLTIKNVVSEEGIQKSDTECGVWCIYYIKNRLEGKSPTYFMDKKITDKDITYARQWLFS